MISSGGFALVPAGAVILHAPALDRYFAELDALDRAGALSSESERELMRRHGLEPT